jgi:hypothetical protein
VFTAGVDTTAPSIPTNLTATAISSSQINLAWTAPIDNVGVTGYKVYRGGVQIANITPAVTTFQNTTGLSAGTAYSYTVAAYDAAGNVSAQSAAVSATTIQGINYTITSIAGANGTITPTGTVSSGASKTITITPNNGYQVANVLVDGASVGAVSTYTFSNVTANHTISATFSAVVAGTTYYVTPAGAGAKNGADWNNACAGFTGTCSASALVRGATYYVAGGSYGSVNFNTPVSGTQLITINKATAGNSGSVAGWQASYGTSQAVFSSLIQFLTGYWVFDGSYRNESDWFDGNSYGFKIANNGAWTNLKMANGTKYVSNVTIKNLYIAAIVGLPSNCGYRPYAIDTETFDNNVFNTGYVFSRVFVEGSNNPYYIRQTTGTIIEYSASDKTSGSSNDQICAKTGKLYSYHGEVVNAFYLYTQGPTVRYNHFRNSYNGASGYPAGGGTGVIAIANTGGMEIYGNIFENYYVGDGAIAAGWQNNNIKIYNNTFVNGYVPSGDIIHGPVDASSSSGNVAYNNLFVGLTCGRSDKMCDNYNGDFTYSNNASSTTSVFVNYAGKDYRLSRATIAGMNLPSPYNVDKSGITRGSVGVWDIGAYEYTGTTPPPTTAALATGLFSSGDRVKVSGTGTYLNVRSSPSATGAILGTQADGMSGTIVANTSNGSYIDGYYWWNVNFDSGADGWVAQSYLSK